LYVADEETNSIFKINATGEFIDEIPLKDKPISIAVDPKSHKIYIVDKEKHYVSVIDGNTNNETGEKINISNINKPVSIAVDPELDILYVADEGYQSLSVIDGNTKETKEQFKVGDKPISIAVDPKTHKVFVLNKGTQENPTTLSVIDLIDGS
ncbi:MAG: YncE family protein, partial [Nitrososphaeraceae archaeon]